MIYKLDEIAFIYAMHKMDEIDNYLNICMPQIKKFINDWLETIDTNIHGQKRYLKKMSKEDLFLTFNYTDTLEKVYKINPENICHIHGIKGQ